MPMGVLTPSSAQPRPSARPPINLSLNFSGKVSAEAPSNISPNPSEVICEVSEPYKNPFWDSSDGRKKGEVVRKYQNSGLPKLLRWSHTLRLDQLFHTLSGYSKYLELEHISTS
jgi:hypothetical protein